ncbi:transaldolase [Candidatus Desulfofervidus auxilii]|uniref:Probable transaldolase n=1 Tax=Desulfofervidus auxilii TaxID=1621989 RepID=A0A7U4QIP1_DESA2|nr:fructose-6-phosphate aldolase [Candidatus Desulfofervidus auxilii]AMM40072.1 transaldolase [Candidatus Desulfofervidus auxilii]
MKFFVDTANVDEIKQAKEMGMADGVTTNPTLVAREKRPFRPLIEEICHIVEGPVSAEVISQEAQGMVKEAEDLVKIAPNIAIKIPMTVEGLKATKILSEKGIRVNMTLVFSPLQALLAAKAGASFVSPFVGRLDDIAHDGMKLVEQIVTIYENYDFATEIIVASVRHPLHVLQAALLGADIATIPFKVIKQLAKHPLTDIGLKRFLDDWQKVADKLL